MDFVCLKALYTDKNVSFAFRREDPDALNIWPEETVRCAGDFSSCTTFFPSHTSTGNRSTHGRFFTADFTYLTHD